MNNAKTINIPFPNNVRRILTHSKMYPKPIFGTNLHGPFVKKSAIPLEEEMTDVKNVVRYRRSVILGFLVEKFRCINVGYIPHMISKIYT